jgi:hypothetical protein
MTPFSDTSEAYGVAVDISDLLKAIARHPVGQDASGHDALLLTIGHAQLVTVVRALRRMADKFEACPAQSGGRFQNFHRLALTSGERDATIGALQALDETIVPWDSWQEFLN